MTIPTHKLLSLEIFCFMFHKCPQRFQAHLVLDTCEHVGLRPPVVPIFCCNAVAMTQFRFFSSVFMLQMCIHKSCFRWTSVHRVSVRAAQHIAVFDIYYFEASSVAQHFHYTCRRNSSNRLPTTWAPSTGAGRFGHRQGALHWNRQLVGYVSPFQLQPTAIASSILTSSFFPGKSNAASLSPIP